MSNILTIAGVFLGCGLAVAMTAVRLPGTWLLLAGAGTYGWLTEWRSVTLGTLILLAVIAVSGEIVELATSALAARRAGGSRRAAWGGLIGGMLGMVFLSFLVPVPLVGSMVGAIAGCFLGAAVAELSQRSHLAHGTRVGFFAALGLAIGTAAKVVLALMMSAIVLGGAMTTHSPNEAASLNPPPALPTNSER